MDTRSYSKGVAKAFQVLSTRAAAARWFALKTKFKTQAQGWGGKGTGLRQGAISKPITIAQKKNLAGLGKDRDEAFPFWDHLFSAAASAIKVKLDDSDDEAQGDGGSSNTSDSEKQQPILKRTATGIICNRRPTTGTPAHDSSGTSTPSTSSGSRYSLIVTAKREAARRGLYSRFFRGPVMGPDTSFEKTIRESSPNPQYAVDDSVSTSVKDMLKQASSLRAEVVAVDGGTEEDGEAERERKRIRKQEKAEKKRRKEEKKGVDGERKKKKRSSKGKEKATDPEESGSSEVTTKEKKKKKSKQDDSSTKKRKKTKHSDPPEHDEDSPPKKKKKRKHEEP
ncbi:hypothetical protein MD484_g1244, partial [Candolleomyces efflorescens]